MKTYFCDGIDETKPRPKLIKSPSDEPPAPDGPKRTSQTRAPPKGYRPLPKTSPNGSITNSPASKRANKSSEPLLRELNNLEDSAVWVWWRRGACCNCVIKKAGLSWVRTPRGNQNTRISCNAVTWELELRPQYNYYITSSSCSVKTVLAVRDLLSTERPRQGKSELRPIQPMKRSKYPSCSIGVNRVFLSKCWSLKGTGNCFRFQTYHSAQL